MKASTYAFLFGSAIAAYWYYTTTKRDEEEAEEEVETLPPPTDVDERPFDVDEPAPRTVRRGILRL